MKRLIALSLSISLATWLTGCDKPAPTTTSPSSSSAIQGPTKKEAKKDTHDHEHSHGAGPHGGTLTDWGGGAYHVEFTVDHGKKEATIFIIGSDEKSPAPIKADKITLTINDPTTELELTAKPLDGETDGMSSRFVGTHDTLGIVKEFAGTISGEIEGTPYAGDFKEEAEGHEH